MKKTYQTLFVSVDLLDDEDILTLSGDELINGGLFGGSEDSKGWT